VVELEEYNTGSGCDGYTLTANGLACLALTPLATATNRLTPVPPTATITQTSMPTMTYKSTSTRTSVPVLCGYCIRLVIASIRL
jgi:hypothetical protein